METYDLKEIKKEIKDNFDYNEIMLFFDVACEQVLKDNPDILDKKIIEHSYNIDDYNGDGEIDDIISRLQKLKEEGFFRIDQIWSGYEDYEFYSVKMEEQTEEEVTEKFLKKVKTEVDCMKNRYKENCKKQQEIASLKKRLYELENNL